MATTSTTDFPAIGLIAKPIPVPIVLNPAPKAASAACPYKATCKAKTCRGDWTIVTCARERKGG